MIRISQGVLAAALGVLVVGVGVAIPATASPSTSTVLFRLTDPRIDEASGIAMGIVSPGVLYVQNDSGDSARFFALDAHTGATVATYTVSGATNVDWEDLAVAPDAQGVPSVWLADIGDNTAERSEIDLYRVDEPHVDPARRGVQASTPAAQVWRLRYPDGAANAESLAVSPTGAAYLITKSLTGDSRVYAVPARPDPSRVQTLRRIGSMRFDLTGTAGGPDPIGQLTATGAALSRDGTVLAVRTYTDAYLWRVRDGNVAAAITSDPVRVALPAQPQGEGIAVDRARLLIDSEHTGSNVYAVDLPVAIAHPAPTTSTATTSVPPTPSAAISVVSQRGGSPRWVGIGAGALVLAMLVVAWRLIGRGRRRQ